MKLILRAFNVPLALLLLTACFAVASALSSGTIPVGLLVQDGAVVVAPIGLVVPVILAGAISITYRPRYLKLEMASLRRLWAYQLAVIAAMVAAAALITVVSLRSSGVPTASAALRNALFFCSLAMLFAPWLGHLSWVPGLLYAATCVLFGSAEQHISGWAWILSPAPSGQFLKTLLLVLAAAGFSGYWSWSRLQRG